MDLSEIYERAKERSLIGEPLVELPRDKVMTDSKGRVFVALKTLIECIENGKEG